MQKRFLRIESADNLFDETGQALTMINKVWSDIDFIKINKELASVEGFKEVSKEVPFDPFTSKNRINKFLIISFKDSSQMIRVIDRNFRRCYCFYSSDQTELTEEELKERYGKNYITIKLIAPLGMRSKDGYDEKFYYFNPHTDEIKLPFPEDLDYPFVPCSVEELSLIIKNNPNIKKIEESNNTFSVSNNTLTLRSTKKFSSGTNEKATCTTCSIKKAEEIEKSIQELKSLMSEEDLKDFNEEELRANLLGSSNSDEENCETDIGENYTNYGYVIAGSEIRCSGNDIHEIRKGIKGPYTGNDCPCSYGKIGKEYYIQSIDNFDSYSEIKAGEGVPVFTNEDGDLPPDSIILDEDNKDYKWKKGPAYNSLDDGQKQFADSLLDYLNQINTTAAFIPIGKVVSWSHTICNDGTDCDCSDE